MKRVVGNIISVTLTFFACVLLAQPMHASAQAVTPITGYAWSDTIGWIDLNCANTSCATRNFGLSIDEDGVISGYAWSDNIGWVSANSADIAGCPSGTCAAVVANGAVTGWLRAISGNTAQSGGWDGFIRLNGSNYGVYLTGGHFSGFAWGDTNVGWLDFSYATTAFKSSQCVNAPITGYAWSDTIGWIDLNCANTSSCASNDFGLSIQPDGTLAGYAWSEHVGWITANKGSLAGCPSGSCKAVLFNNSLTGWLKVLSGGTAQSGSWDGFISLSGTGYGVTRSGNAFSGSAWGDTNLGWVDFSGAGTAYAPATPTYTCSGDSIVYTNDECFATTTTVCTSPAFCSIGSSICLYPQPSANAIGGTDGHMTARPALVRKGSSVTVYWNYSNVTSCSVAGTNGDAWTGASSGLNGKTSGPINRQTTFTLTCGKLGGGTYTETSPPVNIIPEFKER